MTHNSSRLIAGTLLLVALLWVLGSSFAIYRHKSMQPPPPQPLDHAALQLPQLVLHEPAASPEDAFVQRPLFWPERRLAQRDAPTEEQPPVEPSEPPATEYFDQLRLVGVVGAGDSARAIVLDEDKKPQRIAPGEQIHGWQLHAADQERATFRNNGQERILTIPRRP